MAKAFASQADMADKKITFSRLSEHAYAFTAEGDPNTGIVVGDDAVMVIDTQATPKMAEQVIERIRTVTDKPIKYVVLSHYHAVRVLGASGYHPEHIICSEATREHDRRARRAGLQVRAPALPAPVPGGRDGARPDLAHHHLQRPHDPVAGQAAGRHHPCRPRPHQGRHRSSGCPRSARCSAATWSSTAPRPIAGDAHYKDWPDTLQKLRDLKPAGAGAGPRRCADGREARSRRALPARRPS